MARVEMPNSFARSAIANSSGFSTSTLFTSRPFAFSAFIILAQVLFRELADHGLGQLVPEDDLPGHFELGEVVLEEGFKALLVKGFPGLELDIGDGRLAAIFVL